ncbi:MAG: hypothetical protein Q8N99_05050 [Nanoarchaeota archaeon]|nr:hypothetical protein [Nanoarchaeota archaeon]
MPKYLFTEENSRLAALLHGDPNEMHINNRFGRIIAPGLMQLQGFVAMHKWSPDKAIEVKLEKALAVPCNALYKCEENTSYLLSDGEKIYSRALVKDLKQIQKSGSCLQKYRYELTDEQVSLDALRNWEDYRKIPTLLVSKIIPETDQKSLERIAAVGVSANAFVRTLKNNPLFLQDLFFPKAREQGKNAVLEEKIVLYMDQAYDGKRIEQFDLEVYPVRENPSNNKGLIATVSETNGLYFLEIYFVRIPLKIFSRLLKRS